MIESIFIQFIKVRGYICIFSLTARIYLYLKYDDLYHLSKFMGIFIPFPQDLFVTSYCWHFSWIQTTEFYKSNWTTLNLKRTEQNQTTLVCYSVHTTGKMKIENRTEIWKTELKNQTSTPTSNFTLWDYKSNMIVLLFICLIFLIFQKDFFLKYGSTIQYFCKFKIYHLCSFFK